MKNEINKALEELGVDVEASTIVYKESLAQKIVQKNISEQADNESLGVLSEPQYYKSPEIMGEIFKSEYSKFYKLENKMKTTITHEFNQEEKTELMVDIMANPSKYHGIIFELQANFIRSLQGIEDERTITVEDVREILNEILE